MKIGDKVKRKIHYGCEGGSMLPAESGTVVYVHPKGLYYTVEFEFEGRHGMEKIRESYPWKNRQIVETAEDELTPRGRGPRLSCHMKPQRFYANYLECDQMKNKKKGKKPK